MNNICKRTFGILVSASFLREPSVAECMELCMLCPLLMLFLYDELQLHADHLSSARGVINLARHYIHILHKSMPKYAPCNGCYKTACFAVRFALTTTLKDLA